MEILGTVILATALFAVITPLMMNLSMRNK